MASKLVPPGTHNTFSKRDIVVKTADTVAGICYARGSNNTLPAQWLIYVRVKNVSESALKCKELGEKVLDGPRTMGSDQFCVIQDPEGAVLALLSE